MTFLTSKTTGLLTTMLHIPLLVCLHSRQHMNSTCLFYQHPGKKVMFLTAQISFGEARSPRRTGQTDKDTYKKAAVAHRHKKTRIAEGDLICLSSKCLNSGRPSKKLDSKCIGPFPVTKESNPNTRGGDQQIPAGGTPVISIWEDALQDTWCACGELPGEDRNDNSYVMFSQPTTCFSWGFGRGGCVER